MGYRGREQSAPIGESGIEAAAGKEDHFWGTLGMLFVGQVFLQRKPAPRQRWMLESCPKPPAASGSTFAPLSPGSPWAGQGTRLLSARLQHKAGPGEGKGPSGSARVEAARPPGRPQHGRAPLRRRHNSGPEVGFLLLSSVLGPTSRDLPLPARPAPLRQPRKARGRRLRLPARAPRPAQPRPRLRGERARGAAPHLAGARARRLCGRGAVAAVAASSQVTGGGPDRRGARGDEVGAGAPGCCCCLAGSGASGAVLHN